MLATYRPRHDRISPKARNYFNKPLAKRAPSRHDTLLYFDRVSSFDYACRTRLGSASLRDEAAGGELFEALDKAGASQRTTGLFRPPQPCERLFAHWLTNEISGEIRKVLQHGTGCRQPVRHASGWAASRARTGFMITQATAAARCSSSIVTEPKR